MQKKENWKTYQVHVSDVRLLFQVFLGVLPLVHCLLDLVVSVTNNFRHHLRGDEQTPEVNDLLGGLCFGGKFLLLPHYVSRGSPACGRGKVGPVSIPSRPPTLRVPRHLRGVPVTGTIHKWKCFQSVSGIQIRKDLYHFGKNRIRIKVKI